MLANEQVVAIVDRLANIYIVTISNGLASYDTMLTNPILNELANSTL